MAFRSEWVHEPYILRTAFYGGATAGDVNMAMMEYLGAAQEQATYFMMDFTEAGDVPNGLLELPSLLQVINHANTRWMVIVKPEIGQSFMTQLLSREKVKTYRDTPTGLAFLRAMVRVDTGEELTAK